MGDEVGVGGRGSTPSTTRLGSWANGVTARVVGGRRGVELCLQLGGDGRQVDHRRVRVASRQGLPASRSSTSTNSASETPAARSAVDAALRTSGVRPDPLVDHDRSLADELGRPGRIDRGGNLDEAGRGDQLECGELVAGQIAERSRDAERLQRAGVRRPRRAERIVSIETGNARRLGRRRDGNGCARTGASAGVAEVDVVVDDRSDRRGAG